MAHFKGHYTKEQKREAEALGMTAKYYEERDLTVFCEHIPTKRSHTSPQQKGQQSLFRDASTLASQLKREGKLPHYPDRTRQSDYHEFIARYMAEKKTKK